MVYSLADVNAMHQDDFVQAFGFIFEHTPAIAAQSWSQRPFTTLEDLEHAMTEAMDALPDDQKLTLIQAHPDLGSKAKMADASIQEQSGVGLNHLTTAEYARFQALNDAYKAKFNFPFIVAVRDHTKASILSAFEERLTNMPDVEFQRALTEIKRIAQFRLTDAIAHPEP